MLHFWLLRFYYSDPVTKHTEFLETKNTANPMIKQRKIPRSTMKQTAPVCPTCSYPPACSKTLKKNREIYDLEKCAEFVSNFLHYEPLEMPTEPPTCLPSSAQV